MKIPFGSKKQKLEAWAIQVPRSKWVKGAEILRDSFGKDHLVVDNEDDGEDAKELTVRLTFWSDMNEYVKILVAFNKAGIEVVETEEDEEEEKKEDKKKK
jgi:hypothetical protein